MADRVHPIETPSESDMTSSKPFSSSEVPTKPAHPEPEKPIPPPPGTYVIQVPKDQVYRYPPPENARRYQKLCSRKPRRSCCRRCFCWTLCLLLLFIILVAISAGVLYLIFRPESPNYTINEIAIRGMNLTSSSSSSISPEFDVTIMAHNPNDKLGIHYLTGSSVKAFYSDVDLSNGVLPAFYQPSNNVTVFQTALRGSNIVLADAVKSRLTNGQRQGRVPLSLNIRTPVKIKVGSVNTWEMRFKVKCDVTVDNLTAGSRIVSQDCDYRVRLW